MWSYSSKSPFSTLEISILVRLMAQRLTMEDQYIDTIVEEADEGRVDRISQRVYGSLEYMWVCAKFAAITSLDGRIPAGTVLRLPSIPNILKALQRERYDKIPVFEFIQDPNVLQQLQAGGSTGTGTAIPNTVYEGTSVETIMQGQILALTATGKTTLAKNDGVLYKVIGVARVNATAGAQVEYLTQGELTIANWADIRDDGDANAPPANTILWLSETDAGKVMVTAPSTAGKHAVRIGTMRAGNTLYIDIGQPLGI